MRKTFFFGKKNQKNFCQFAVRRPIARHQTDKVFLLLFLQKKKILQIAWGALNFPSLWRSAARQRYQAAAER
ncbi:hypothetical protein CR165_01555 [Pseudoroseomonas aestuarii]|uniref:Uncharacterized protein n=1 Tax=Teichococcus aestuarii TaxID=568898 RepID=A0A2U1V9R8_9PROT|nr:hypothetical protein CR165_01555 [Pseudoroseomonas aestuarii]